MSEHFQSSIVSYNRGKKRKKILWNDKNFDIAYDLEPLPVDQEYGNKGLGAIVFVLCAVAILLPSSITISQVINNTATGNPFGAVASITLILGWPTYWGFSQFFLRRLIIIRDGIITFEFISFLKNTTTSIKVSEYGQIETGKIPSLPRDDVGLGYTGIYFVRLKHKNDKYNIDLYNMVKKQMDQNRLAYYSKILNLPVIDVTPKQTAKERMFRQRIKSTLERGK